jgi:hypothetical protein
MRHSPEGCHGLPLLYTHKQRERERETERERESARARERERERERDTHTQTHMGTSSVGRAVAADACKREPYQEKKSSEVSALVHLLHKVAIWSTFENLCVSK